MTDNTSISLAFQQNQALNVLNTPKKLKNNFDKKYRK